MENFTQAILLDPNNSYAYYYRGFAYSNLKEYQKALEDYQKAAQLYQQQGKKTDYQDALKKIEELQQQL